MNNTHFYGNIQNSIKQVYQEYPLLWAIVKKLHEHQAVAYLVGGSVRDMFLGQSITDLDIEVHGIELNALSELLSLFGPVSLVGKSFGVLKLHHMPIDWSLPRTDTAGRKPVVTLDPYLDINEALRRRDLTINAMALNLHTHELIDPFGGQNDLKNRILRSPDVQFFTQDPLRFYRVMQFVARFEMQPDEALNEVCSTMDIATVSVERVQAEFEKMLLKSKRPSLGIRWLDTINRLQEILPQVYQTKTVAQEPDWHPEGFVFEHLMQTLDASASIIHNASASILYKNNEIKLQLLFAAMCHDIGKAKTSIIKDGRIKSPGHAEIGAPMAKAMLSRISRRKHMIEVIVKLVKYHMHPMQFVNQDASLAAYRRLALKLKGYATLSELSQLALADQRGRNGKSHEPLTTDIPLVNTFIERANQAGVLNGIIEPLLAGSDVMDLVAPGPEMGKLLKYAYKMQIEKGIVHKQELKRILDKRSKQ